ncbi:ABC transporter ATP-binding protein/permease [Coprobacillus cateniformis]|nr:ABC transporter ATP-binding protein/permease [Coprobacillus cateniformis]
MFDKRLIKEIPEAKAYVKRQVLCQWIALIMNIIFTVGLSYTLVLLFQEQLTIEILMIGIVFAIILFVIRGIVLKKATQFSFAGASLVKKILRERLFKKILELGGHYQDYVATSELVQLGGEGINQLETYFALYLPQLFYSVLAPVTLFIIISFYDFMSALVLFLCVPMIPLSIVLIQKIAKKLLAKYWNSYTTLGDSFLENLQGLTTLKIYQSDEFKQKEMNKEAENCRKVTMRVLIMQLNSISVMDIVAYGGAGLGSYFAITHYMYQEISLFIALFIILLSFEFFIPLRQLGSFFHIAMNGIAASEKLFRVFDIEHQQSGKFDFKEGDFGLCVDQLSFQYTKEQPLLKEVSFQIKPNQFVGIVGESGSGKSTIAKLIMGYHQDYQGEIRIQTHQRYDIDDTVFFNHFVYMTHDPMIFKGTLRENIDMLNQYQDKEIWEALEKVNLASFFHQHNGLQTLLLESGSNLSGGQKQRLNLARAILKNGDVYIFDEATSNIDVESENAILEVIKDLSKEKTILFITHRLSSVIDCDDILVMKQGELIEQGTHQQLKAQNGVYAQMFTKQAKLEVYQG